MANAAVTNSVRTHSLSETFVESGEAYRRLAGLTAAVADSQQRLDVIVIGAGQAGLSTGYFLAKRGLRFVILNAHSRVGDPWRQRWDSLRLFTPARYDSLVGLPFPAPPYSFPSKDEMADYLEAYARRFNLPVRSGMRAERLFRKDGVFCVRAGNTDFQADQVVVAMSNYQQGRAPSFAAELSPDIVQLHSSDYRKPSQLGRGEVLIVGAGNSGSEVAMELARSHKVWMSGRDTGQVPFRINGFWARFIMLRVVLRFMFHYLMTIKTPIGRKMRLKVLHQGGPLIRVKSRDLERAGVARVAKVVGVRDGYPLLADGRILKVANVVWCTGYRAPFPWIDLPVIDEQGEPRHQGGIVADVPGLYFVGLHFLYSFSSTMIHGVGRDAKRIVTAIERRIRDRSIRPSAH
jgi:putative flavoprotein involved in K+ transport